MYFFKGFPRERAFTRVPGNFTTKLPKGRKRNPNKTTKMKTLSKTLSVLAISGAFAGAAFAGPGDAYAPYGTLPAKKDNATQIALFRSGGVNSAEKNANFKEVTLFVNPKTHTPVVVKVAR